MKFLISFIAGRQLRHALNFAGTQPLFTVRSLHGPDQKRCYTSPTSWDYATERRTFHLEAPEFYNFARDVVDKWAQKDQTGERNPGNPALWWVDQTLQQEEKWSYTEIAEASRRVANLLTNECNLSYGDIAIVILPRIPQWWVINVAAIRAGVILSPGTTLLRPKDVRHRLEASGAKCIITNADCADTVDQVADECPGLRTKLLVGGDRPGWLNYDQLAENSSDYFQCVNSRSRDPMTVFFTSGTTGAPKMTEHTHSSYGLGHLLTARYLLGLTVDDVMWNLSDTGWAKCAWTSLFAPWIAGSCVFVQNASKFDAKQTLQILNQYPISHFCAPPTAVRFLVKLDLGAMRFPALRVSICAGEPVNPELLKAWKESTGVTLYEAYGQTETTFLCGTFPSIGQRPGSMGKASPGIDLQIVDDEGTVLPRGKEGNIAVKCKPVRPVGLFSRYVNDEERMKHAFKGDYYLTGDRGMMDEDSYVWFLSRADDVILSSGYRIGPFEVESALLEHPAVLESAVVSSPDPDRGEIVKAFVILTEKYKTADRSALALELQQHTKDVTAPYKYPRKIEFVDSLPKTVSGKIRRVELRNNEWGRPTP